MVAASGAQLPLLLTVLCLLYLSTVADILKLTSLACESFNRSIVEFKYCRIEAFTRTRNILSVYVVTKQKIRTAILTVKLYRRRNGWQPFAYNFKLDGCRFMENHRGNFLVLWVWNYFQHYTNLNHSCPFDHDLLVDGFQMPNTTVKLPLPYDRYLMDIHFALNGPLKTTRINFTVQFMEF